MSRVFLAEGKTNLARNLNGEIEISFGKRIRVSRHFGSQAQHIAASKSFPFCPSSTGHDFKPLRKD